MANRRMFSSKITNSGRFLTMPPSTQNLYFHLGMMADDDGVVEAHTVIKITDSKIDDYNLLIAKRFIYPLTDDLVVVILDWREHNLIRPDRKIDSIYKKLLEEKLPDVELVQARPRADLISGRPVDNQRTTKGPHRLGKVRLGKDIKEKIYKKEKPSYPIESVTTDDIRDIAKEYELTYAKVAYIFEQLKLYDKKTYKNYKLALRKWVVRDLGVDGLARARAEKNKPKIEIPELIDDKQREFNLKKIADLKNEMLKIKNF